MKTTNSKIEASAPANVRPSKSVSKTSSFPKLDFKLRQQNRQLPTKKLLALIESDVPQFQKLARVVGQWVWIQFRQKQPSSVTAILSQLGFHWNRKRQTWQHPCGVYCASAATHDPRNRYGSRLAATN